MRKLFACMLSVTILFSLSACRNRAEDGREQTGMTESAAMQTGMVHETDTVSEADMAHETDTVSETDTAYETEQTMDTEDNIMKIAVGDAVFTVTFENNSSVEALKELLREGPLTIHMSDYAGMEKVGPVGRDLPENNEQIRTEAGDIILYQGNSLVIYYDTNDWSLTRIGKIDQVTQEELKEALGEGDVTVTFSLE